MHVVKDEHDDRVALHGLVRRDVAASRRKTGHLGPGSAVLGQHRDIHPLARDIELEVVLGQATQVVALFVGDHDVKRDEVRAEAENRLLLSAERNSSQSDSQSGRDTPSRLPLVW